MNAYPSQKPRVGIPYRTRNEELTNKREAYDKYLEAARRAGGEPVEISLALADSELKKLAESLDAFLIPGSPADVHPALFKAAAHPHGSFSDPRRETTDFTLLENAFAGHKPVLAICYGNQSLNVFLGGSLVQDIPSEVPAALQHSWPGHAGAEPHHAVSMDPASRVAKIVGKNELRVNSSHHQSVLAPGKGLQIVARAPDGVIEAVEWNGDENWVVGVQWHPERMIEDDESARALFDEWLAMAREGVVRQS
ncbi:MAG: gamma-glutamyl-gamma-aminobutyrate hydrolase family protein [Candidatus Acidiferrales bacterium]